MSDTIQSFTQSKHSYCTVKDTESSKSVGHETREAGDEMSDTPETDMLESNQQHDCVPYDDAAEQLAELCQKLERERDEARLQYSTTLVFCQSLVKERLGELEVAGE